VKYDFILYAILFGFFFQADRMRTLAWLKITTCSIYVLQKQHYDLNGVRTVYHTET